MPFRSSQLGGILSFRMYCDLDVLELFGLDGRLYMLGENKTDTLAIQATINTTTPLKIEKYGLNK